MVLMAGLELPSKRHPRSDRLVRSSTSCTSAAARTVSRRVDCVSEVAGHGGAARRSCRTSSSFQQTGFENGRRILGSHVRLDRNRSEAGARSPDAWRERRCRSRSSRRAIRAMTGALVGAGAAARRRSLDRLDLPGRATEPAGPARSACSRDRRRSSSTEVEVGRRELELEEPKRVARASLSLRSPWVRRHRSLRTRSDRASPASRLSYVLAGASAVMVGVLTAPRSRISGPCKAHASSSSRSSPRRSTSWSRACRPALVRDGSDGQRRRRRSSDPLKSASCSTGRRSQIRFGRRAEGSADRRTQRSASRSRTSGCSAFTLAVHGESGGSARSHAFDGRRVDP